MDYFNRCALVEVPLCREKEKKGQQNGIKTELKENYFPMEKIPYAVQDDLLDWMAAGFGWIIA